MQAFTMPAPWFFKENKKGSRKISEPFKIDIIINY